MGLSSVLDRLRKQRRRLREQRERRWAEELAELEASVAKRRASVWRSIGIADEAWPAIRDRWASDPELREYMENYPLGLLPDPQLRTLLLAGDYVALRSEMERAEAEAKARSDQWFKERSKCPRCGRSGVHLLYGRPSEEGFEAARKGDVVLAGCIVRGNDPEWRCKICQKEWGRLRRYPYDFVREGM